MMPERAHVYREPLVEGFRRGGHGERREGFAIAPFVDVKIDDDHARALLAVRQSLALYVGGMGARGRNFYNDYARRLGFGEAAEVIQNRFLSGDKQGAVAAVPDEFARRHRPGRTQGAHQGAARGMEARRRPRAR